MRPSADMDKASAVVGSANDMLSDVERQELIDYARGKGLTDACSKTSSTC